MTVVSPTFRGLEEVHVWEIADCMQPAPRMPDVVGGSNMTFPAVYQ